MPLSLIVPEREFYDPNSCRFIMIRETRLELEHSLLSISKWEAKWHKPYLSLEEKTPEEAMDYIRCMSLIPGIDPNVFYGIDRKNSEKIRNYISDPMTATTVKHLDKRPNREIITNEIIYYWMAEFGIPFDPCQKWHLNHLMALIEVAAAKSQPPKKMPKKEWLNQRAALNAQRRARYNTTG